ncbi:MAG: hypothetical protein ACR2GR_11205 [Rhodothermales bacterium]
MSRTTAWIAGLLACSLYALPALAQTSMEGGARAAALGGAATALEGDAWGQANPAAWGTLPGRAVSFFASEGFGLEALRLGAVQYAEPTPFGAFAADVRTFGFEEYRETQGALGYARRFAFDSTRTFALGLSVRYYQVTIEGFGNASTVGISAGWLARVLPDVTVGFHATNLNRPELASREALPRTFALGLAYRPDARLQVLLDAYKDIDFPVSIRGGLEVLPVEALALRAGFTTQPTRFTTGVGVRLGRIAADVAAERHETLGWTPGVAFGLRW